MRGTDERSGSLFSYVDLEARVRRDQPLRLIREIANAALADLSAAFGALYPPRLGRPSIPPERLLRAMLLQAFYGIRSERQLMEPMEFDLLFRWFVGLGVDDPVWDHSSFTTRTGRILRPRQPKIPSGLRFEPPRDSGLPLVGDFYGDILRKHPEKAEALASDAESETVPVIPERPRQLERHLINLVRIGWEERGQADRWVTIYSGAGADSDLAGAPPSPATTTRRYREGDQPIARLPEYSGNAGKGCSDSGGGVPCRGKHRYKINILSL